MIDKVLLHMQCGNMKEFLVLRSGADFRIRCKGCGREVLVPRVKVERNIKKIMRDGAEVEKNPPKPQRIEE